MNKLDNIKSPAVKTCVTIMLTTALFGAAFVLLYFRSNSITQVEVSSVKTAVPSRELTVSAISREIVNEAATDGQNVNADTNGVRTGNGESIYSKVPEQVNYTQAQIDSFISSGKFTKDLMMQMIFIVEHEKDASHVAKYETCYVMANAAFNFLKASGALEDPVGYCNGHPKQIGVAWNNRSVDYSHSEAELLSNPNRTDAVVQFLLLESEKSGSGDIIRGCGHWFSPGKGGVLYLDGNMDVKQWYALGDDAVGYDVIYKTWGELHNTAGSPKGKVFYENKKWYVSDGEYYEG